MKNIGIVTYLTQDPMIRDVYLRAFTDEIEHATRFGFLQTFQVEARKEVNEYGEEPFVVNIEKATKQNNTFRTAIWTRTKLQVTIMSINGGEAIGL
jgi:hypothetical protein